jgi:hypothetical protein
VRKSKFKRLATRKPREEIMSQESQEDTAINTNGSSFCVLSQMQPRFKIMMVYSELVQHCGFFFLVYSLFIVSFVLYHILPFFLFFSLCIYLFQYMYISFCNFISHCSLLFVEGTKGEIIYGYHKDQKPRQQRSRLWNV